MAVVCASAARTPAFGGNPRVSVVNGSAPAFEDSDLALTPTTLTEPRHNSRRVLPHACPSAPARSARGLSAPVVPDGFLRITSQTTERGDLCCARIHGLGDHSAATALASNARARRDPGGLSHLVRCERSAVRSARTSLTVSVPLGCGGSSHRNCGRRRTIRPSSRVAADGSTPRSRIAQRLIKCAQTDWIERRSGCPGC